MTIFNKIIKKITFLFCRLCDKYPSNVKKCLLYGVSELNLDVLMYKPHELEIAIIAVANGSPANLKLTDLDIDFLLDRFSDEYRKNPKNNIVPLLMNAVGSRVINITSTQIDREIARCSLTSDQSILCNQITNMFNALSVSKVSSSSFLYWFRHIDFNYYENYKNIDCAMRVITESILKRDKYCIFDNKTISHDIWLEKFNSYDISSIDVYGNNIMRYLLAIPDSVLFKKILDVLVKNGLDLHFHSPDGRLSVIEGLKWQHLNILDNNSVVDNLVLLCRSGLDVNYSVNGGISVSEYLVTNAPSVMSRVESRLLNDYITMSDASVTTSHRYPKKI